MCRGGRSSAAASPGAPAPAPPACALGPPATALPEPAGSFAGTLGPDAPGEGVGAGAEAVGGSTHCDRIIATRSAAKVSGLDCENRGGKRKGDGRSGRRATATGESDFTPLKKPGSGERGVDVTATGGERMGGVGETSEVT